MVKVGEYPQLDMDWGGNPRIIGGEHVNWNQQEDTLLLECREKGLSQRQTAEKLTKQFNRRFTRNAVKNRERLLKDKNGWKTDKVDYKETREILPDGSHKSDILLKMSSEQSKDKEYLLKAHGYDIDDWELVSARNNIWNAYSKQDGVQTLYSSKITVKPKTDISYEKLIEAVRQAEPIFLTAHYKEPSDWMLEISYVDTHFGISDYEHYRDTQIETIDKIQKRTWREILFTIGQDMFHNDDFRARTSSGREIQQVDMVKAWEDARKFYEPMIEEAIKHSEKVKIIFSKGNHDESMGWAFVQYLKARYPQCEFDDSFQERKIHVFGKTFLGITHGDKGRKEIHNIFAAEFPIEWANATCREIHMGHFHIEDLKDRFGTRVRTLTTKNRTDQWHKDNGYVGGHKEFMLFEYNMEKLKNIHYV